MPLRTSAGNAFQRLTDVTRYAGVYTWSVIDRYF